MSKSGIAFGIFILCSCAKLDGGNLQNEYSPIRNVQYIEENLPSLLGEKVVVDGYFSIVCEKLAKDGCKYGGRERRYILFGTPTVDPTDTHQPCSSNGGPELLLDGYFPASLGTPVGQRVLISGILRRKTEQLPKNEGSERRVLVFSVFEYSLYDVKILKKYGTKCSFTTSFEQ